MNCCDDPPNLSTSGSVTACVPGAFTGGLARTRFFDGMFLTQADLENEQLFWRMKRRLTNRALGTGVVWGLRLRWDAKGRRFVLGPGYALDCCGNDLIVECPVEVTEGQLVATADPALKITKPTTPSITTRAANPLRHACVALQYVECPEDARPVHLDACAPPGNRCEPSRIRETARLVLVPPPEPPPRGPLDGFFEELDQLREQFPSLFPTPPTPTPTPSPDPNLPATLVITAVGSQASAANPTSVTITPRTNATTDVGTTVIARSSSRSAIVQFDLTPNQTWGFYQGEVVDQVTNGIVDRVTPPFDLQQFWSLEIVLGDNTRTATREFKFGIDALGLERFGGGERGPARVVISGLIEVRPADGNMFDTIVSKIQVMVESSIAVPPDGPRGCLSRLDGLLTLNPAYAEDHVGVLVLAAAYAYLSEMSAQSGGQATAAAWAAYVAAWQMFFGVDFSIQNAEEQKRELSRILGRLFDRWCDAMLYPGPRCTDEHHGVYLGCVELGRSGAIVSFDMWENRRHVITGPLLAHWLGLFGVAPIDVVAARLAQLICCVGGLAVPELPPQPPFLLRPVPVGGAVIGTTRTPRAGGIEISAGELVRRMLGALIDSPAGAARYVTRTPSGIAIELSAGNATMSEVSGNPFDAIVERLERRPPAIARTLVRAAALELALDASPTAIVDGRGRTGALAKTLGERGVTLADLIARGDERIWSEVPNAEAATVSELLDRVDAAATALASAIAEPLHDRPPARPTETLRDVELHKAIAKAATRTIRDLTADRVAAALERVASRMR